MALRILPGCQIDIPLELIFVNFSKCRYKIQVKFKGLLHNNTFHIFMVIFAHFCQNDTKLYYNN